MAKKNNKIIFSKLNQVIRKQIKNFPKINEVAKERTDNLRIFTRVCIIGLTLFCVLTNDGCRNSTKTQSETNKQNTPEESNKSKLEVNEGKIEATKLFTEFTAKEKEARGKYIGKTILITGTISEVFVPHSLIIMTDSKTKNKAAGIMLFPETKESQQKLAENGKSFSDFPEVRLYDLLEQQDKSALSPLGFSHRSEYGGGLLFIF